MHLKKRIPQGAGLGGGSADAAAALLGLNRLWKLGLSLERLRELALKLGADVPYCLCGRPARVRGIGERIEAFPLKRSYWLLVLQTFPGGLGTRQVFEAYSSQTRHRRYDQSTSPRVIHALQSGNLKALSRAAVNDLRPCAEALRPEILSAVKEVKEAGAAFVQMSGSGSAVFGVFPSFLRAVRTRRRLSAKFPLIYLARTLRSREAP